MAILDVLRYPDGRLKEKAKGLTEINGPIRKLAMDMIETMYREHGVGLAAPQVGVSLRLVVIDIAQLEGSPRPVVYINPEILEGEGRRKEDEG